jgi:hypothetical protein
MKEKVKFLKSVFSQDKKKVQKKKILTRRYYFKRHQLKNKPLIYLLSTNQKMLNRKTLFYRQLKNQ